MKKIGFVALIMLASISATFAQKIAVLDFKAGVGISQTDVDGLSSTFVTYFNPRGYQLVERSQINQVIEEQGFQQTSLTESQMVRLGQIMNLSKIVVGDVNIVGGSPNLDVRVIDVQNGEVTGRDGATFAWTNYRATMQQLAQKIANQIGVVYGGSGQRGYSQPNGKSPSGTVETILGYLQVYPEDLGSYNGTPSSVIAAVNRQKLNGYGDWRLPTNEELSLMATAKDKLGMSSISGYMSCENANSAGMKLVRLVRSESIEHNNNNFGHNHNINQSYSPEDKNESKVKLLTYNEFLKKVWDFERDPNTFNYKGELPAVIDFYADWCGPCRRVAPIMEKLAEEYDGKLLIYKVNTQNETGLANAFQIRSIPTVLFIPMEGQPMMQVGALPEEGYRQVIEQQLLDRPKKQ